MGTIPHLLLSAMYSVMPRSQDARFHSFNGRLSDYGLGAVHQAITCPYHPFGDWQILQKYHLASFAIQNSHL